MHSTEPFERSVNPPSQPPAGDAAWRAEVAARVHRYRASRKAKAGEQDSLALDFGPASATGGPSLGLASATGGPSVGLASATGGPSVGLASATGGPSVGLASATGGPSVGLASATGGPSVGPYPPPGPAAGVHRTALHRAVAPGEPPRGAAHNAFDTNYYRRLNAQSLEQSAVPDATQRATSSAVATALPEGEAMLASALDLELHPAPSGDASLERYRIADAEPETCGPETLFEAAVAPCGAAEIAAPVLPAQNNLIVFPRVLLEPPLLPQPSRDELAEPVSRRPRILEVPEDILPAMQGSLFPEIRLDADEPEGCASCEPEIEVPLRVAPVAARLMASLVDLGMVLAAGALFAAIAGRALPGVPHTKPFWMAMAAVTMLLWAVYQQLFLLYAGRTVGMAMSRIHLSTFDGRVPQWAERRRRARFILISFAAVALGFLWALVDKDSLCWHDRVSQTFPTTD